LDRLISVQHQEYVHQPPLVVANYPAPGQWHYLLFKCTNSSTNLQTASGCDGNGCFYLAIHSSSTGGAHADHDRLAFAKWLSACLARHRQMCLDPAARRCRSFRDGGAVMTNDQHQTPLKTAL
jgi:hypothetical protein